MKIMKHLFLLSTIILALNSCKTKPEPNPAQAFDGNYVTTKTTPPVSFTIKDGKATIDTATACYISGNVDRAVFEAFEFNTIYILLKLENNILLASTTSYNTQQEAEAATSPTFKVFANKI